MYKIFIVEDDRVISSLMQNSLEKWGFEVRCAADFAAVTEEFAKFGPHLVLLDISLPCYNGFYWCTEIRHRSRVPVMFISSHTEDMDIVMAMNMGADDYITKPFSTDVMVAKINSLLRRSYQQNEEQPEPCVRGARLCPDGTLAFENERYELTKNEYRILKLLFENCGAVVRRDAIMKALWDSESFIDDNTLTVNINRLRKKLTDCGLDGLIETKKGEGYLVHDI